ADSPGQTAGGENMVRARRVVAEDGGRPEEDRARVPHAFGERVRVVDEELEMLWSDRVRALDRFGQRADQLDPGPVADAGGNSVRELGARGQQDRRAVG